MYIHRHARSQARRHAGLQVGRQANRLLHMYAMIAMYIYVYTYIYIYILPKQASAYGVLTVD